MTFYWLVCNNTTILIHYNFLNEHWVPISHYLKKQTKTQNRFLFNLYDLQTVFQHNIMKLRLIT